jgi:hypothetical protein
MTADEDHRQALADRLRDLSLPELIDVLRRVLPEHDVPSEEGRPPHRLVLAEATKVGDSGPKPDPYDPAVWIEVVAWPDSEYYDGGMGPTPHLFEGGTCRRCGIEVTCNVKRAFCSVCGDRVSLT